MLDAKKKITQHIMKECMIFMGSIGGNGSYALIRMTRVFMKSVVFSEVTYNKMHRIQVVTEIEISH